MLTSLNLVGGSTLLRSRSSRGAGALTAAGAGACTRAPARCALGLGGWAGSSSGAGTRVGFLLLRVGHLGLMSTLLLGNVGTTIMPQGCFFSRAAIPAGTCSNVVNMRLST